MRQRQVLFFFDCAEFGPASRWIDEGANFFSILAESPTSRRVRRTGRTKDETNAQWKKAKASRAVEFRNDEWNEPAKSASGIPTCAASPRRSSSHKGVLSGRGSWRVGRWSRCFHAIAAGFARRRR